ncbi:MAG: TonB-dependent receptor plug domain-containing protein [Bacteroidales bacterium]|nr:TonB-dependent receptor plug domain-containing protein [Bacteroidales bacterium]
MHNITSLPVENAAIYNKSYTIAVYTNGEGKADLKKFSRNDSIYIRHPSVNTIGLTYQDIVDMNFVLLISKRSILMDDIVVTAYRWQEKKRDLPFQTDIIKIREMTIPQTSADILSSAGNLMLQKSQGGGGSPVIRGFEANRVLLVLDGVRLNNAIYRSGHLQNSMTLDMGGLDRVEIIYGPASVIYGSDALGGVVHYHTREPILSDENKFLIKADAFTKYSSASNSNISSIGVNAGFKKFAWFSSYTLSNFGDIRMGKNRNPFLGDHGKAYYQTVFLDGRDSVISNTNTDIQPNTGYRQFDLTQKLLVLLSRNLKLSGNFQYSTSSRIHRYDELSIYNNAVPNYATWYYGPQNRLFGSVSLFSDGETVLFSGYKAVLAYQRIDEDRINRRFRRDNELHQEEDVDVFHLISISENHYLPEICSSMVLNLPITMLIPTDTIKA